MKLMEAGRGDRFFAKVPACARVWASSPGDSNPTMNDRAESHDVSQSKLNATFKLLYQKMACDERELF